MENEPYSEGFNTHVWHFSGDRWETIHLLNQPRHVTPQINHPRKNNPCSEGYQDIFMGFLRR